MNLELPPRWKAALEIIQLDFPDAVIAGGALRDLILGREPKDIDVFAEHRPFTPSQHLYTAADIKDWAQNYLGPARCVINDAWAAYNDALDGVVCAVEIDAALTRPLPIQLITMNRPVTFENVVDRIDFGLCRVSHDGEQLFTHPHFHQDRAREVFTLRRCTGQAQYDRSVQRHARLYDKYPWPMRVPVSVLGTSILP